MADPTQYSFSFAELAKLMFQAGNIHEGQWVVGIEYNVTVAPVGLTPNEAYPGAVIAATKLVLSAVGDDPVPPNLVFDAATVNPASAKANPVAAKKK
jgi:hypothetical protein